MSTDRDWGAFLALLRRGWPGEFTEEDQRAYRLLLEGVPVDELVVALRRILQSGERFRPTASELIAMVRDDPGQPTFEEMLALVFGPTGILRAQPPRGQTWPDQAARARAYREAIEARAERAHPLVHAFVLRYGVDRLRNMSIDDPETGGMRRRELEGAWDRHVGSFEARDIAGLAAGGRAGDGLRRFDPLGALGLKPAGELEESDDGR